MGLPKRRTIAAALSLVAIAGCGTNSGGGSVPRGNPDNRHGPQAVDNYAAVALLRALVVTSSDSYYAGASAADARTQLLRARQNYDTLAGHVKTADPVVDREVVARFNLLQTSMRRGIAPDHYRDLATPLGDQLMDGVVQALVPQSARTDRGVQAETLNRLVARLDADYDASASGTDQATARLAFEEGWGLYRQALAITSNLKPFLGSKANTITGTLANLKTYGFPTGPIAPDAPPATKVDAETQKIIAAVDSRFGLQD